MTDIAIRAENLSKQYRIGGRQEGYRTFRDTLTKNFTAPFRRLSSVLRGQSTTFSHETIWALKNVSFDIKQGEVVGIIGKNGAGKSTLLKILSQITEPTEGYAEIHGRVGSLLEIGTGFHPELSGRENIYLNGAILGMKRFEIKRKFDEIVAFAEIDKFIDTPVKYYSSGMYMRLAFSVTAHLESEILLVDEVLAVGDAAFQKKCIGKISDISKKNRTVLFVSHNMGAIRSLCKRCVLLDDAKVIMDGDTNDVVANYLAIAHNKTSSTLDTSHLPRPENHGTKLMITQVKLLGIKERAAILLGSPFEVELQIEVREPLEKISLGLGVFSYDGIKVIGSSSGIDCGFFTRLQVGTYILRAKLDPFYLTAGTYLLDMDVRSEKERLDFLGQFFPFKILETRDIETTWFRIKEGFITSRFDWDIDKIS